MTEQLWTKEEQKEHRKLWIETLRSGEYKQTTGALKRVNGYCCLGVACEVAIQNGLKLSVNKIEGESRYTYDGGCNLLPNAVQDYYGLSSRGGKYGNTSLVIQNDENHKTFKEIADIIETEPAGLIEN